MAVQACRWSPQLQWYHRVFAWSLAKAPQHCSRNWKSMIHAEHWKSPSPHDYPVYCARSSSRLIAWAHSTRALCSQVLSACHCSRLPHWSIPHSRACSACKCRKMVVRLARRDQHRSVYTKTIHPALPLQAVLRFLHVKQAAPMRRRFG